jgi:hypothetical protein
MSAVQQAIGYRVLAGASLASWIAAGTAMPADAQSWDRFRGPMGAGVATTTGLPAQLEGSLVWEAALPAGKSSPIVSGDRLFVTAWEGDTRHVICLDRKTGRRIWQRQLLKLHERDVNRLNDPAAPTPATDGERVFAFFPEAGLVAYAAHDGTERWFVPLGPFNSVHGMAASPIVANGLVILPIEQQTGGSFLTALDAATGARRWQTTLADTGQQGYGTAFVHESSQGRAEIVMSRPGEIGGWSLATGDPIWWVRGTGTQVYSVPAVSGSIIYAAADGDTVEGAMQAWEQWLAKYKRTRERTLRVKEDWGDNTLERADRTWGNQDGLFDEHEWRHFVRTSVHLRHAACQRGGGCRHRCRLWLSPEYRRSENVFRETADLTCVSAPPAEDALVDAIRTTGARHAIVGSTFYRGPLYAALPRGSVLARYGVGHEGIDKAQASRHGLLCTNTPDVLHQSVAELTMLLIGAAARHLLAISNALTAGAGRPCRAWSWRADAGGHRLRDDRPRDRADRRGRLRHEGGRLRAARTHRGAARRRALPGDHRRLRHGGRATPTSSASTSLRIRRTPGSSTGGGSRCSSRTPGSSTPPAGRWSTRWRSTTRLPKGGSAARRWTCSKRSRTSRWTRPTISAHSNVSCWCRTWAATPRRRTGEWPSGRSETSASRKPATSRSWICSTRTCLRPGRDR